MNYLDEVYKLREQGLSYKEIEEHLRNRGIDIPWFIIKNMCKRIYKEKNDNRISSEEIYNLREQGLTYAEITDFFRDKGINVTSNTIRNRCKIIYEEKCEKEPKIKRHHIEKINISELEVYNLRKQGLSYRKIAEIFQNKGINVSREVIRARCKSIYKEKGEKEPDCTANKRSRVLVSDEEIYNLREQALTYNKIAEIINNKGIKVCVDTIAKRCRKIYKDKGQQEPKCKPQKTGKRINISEEELFSLREQGLPYRQIQAYYIEKGIQVSFSTIDKRCDEIYKKKGLIEPKCRKENRKKIPTILKVSDEELYNLREQGLSYRKIEKKLQEKGIKVSFEAIRSRCKKVYETKNEKDVKKSKQNTVNLNAINDKGRIRKNLLKLKDTKNATDEQISQMAKMYGIDINEKVIEEK